jgi:Tfp pilus assembly protein PilO
MIDNPPKKLSYQEKLALSAFIFFAIVLCLIYLVINPSVQSIKNSKARIDAQQMEAEKNYAQGQNLKKLTENIKIIEPRLPELDQFFINKNDALSFITALETSAAQNNVTEKASLGDESALNSFYSQIPLTLDISGNADGVIDFITYLETKNYYINIDSLSVEKGPADNSQKTLQAHIVAETYWEN